MESLSNFNFLKVFDVKKNNDNNANEKNLLSSEKSFIIDQVESIDNEFDNALSGQALNEDFVLLQKQKNKKFKRKLNIEGSDFLLGEPNIKTADNNYSNHVGHISSQKQKDKISFLNLTNDSSLNTNLSNDKGKILTKNFEKALNLENVKNELEDNLLNKPQSGFENTKDNKLNLNTLSKLL